MLVVLGVPDPVLPADDQGVPDGRRRLHGHPRQLRAAAGAGRRRRAAHRLRPHRRGVGRRRHRRARVGVRRRSRRTRVPISVAFIVAHRLRQPAGRARSRAGSSPSRPTSSSSTWSCCSASGLVQAAFGGTCRSTRSTTPGLDPRSGSAGSGIFYGRRRSSSCCTPSPRAAPRSPASRRSPTACPRSASRRGRTPARRS